MNGAGRTDRAGGNYCTVDGRARGAAIGELPPEQDDGHEGTARRPRGTAIPEPAEDPPAPVAINADPVAAMQGAADLPPDQMQHALGGVGAAVGRSVAADRAELANRPPEETPPAAPPGGVPVPPGETAAPPPVSIERVAEPGTPTAGAAPAPPVAATPMPSIPIPAVTSNAEGQVTDADARHIAESVGELPVSDPGLNVTAGGSAPTLSARGRCASGARTQQRAAVATALQTGSRGGMPRRRTADGRGPDRTDRAGGNRAGGDTGRAQVAGTSAAPTAPTDPATAIIARERSADTVRSAATAPRNRLATARTEQQTKRWQARADGKQRLDAEGAANVAQQARERGAARSEVEASRRDWTDQQRDLVTDANTESDQKVTDAQQEAASQTKRPPMMKPIATPPTATPRLQRRAPTPRSRLARSASGRRTN